jgi:hypothetical protein
LKQPFALFDTTSSFHPFYMMLLVNRLQVLYFVLTMPMYLVYPFMIWGILAMGILSQINIMLLSKGISSSYAQKGYQGFVQLIGEPLVRIFAFIGLCIILIKMSVITLSYVDIIKQFIFPSLNSNWLIFAMLLTSFYIAAQGMDKTIRFVVIVFLSTGWIFLMFIPFFIPPFASLHDLYPLVPTEWSNHQWKGLLIVWSSLSGPEFLICLLPWLKPGKTTLKYLTIGNAFTVLEYMVLFIASLLFFGSNLLRINNFPILNMVRYLQTLIFERIDIILLSIHMFIFVYAGAIFMLCIYGAARILVGRTREQTTKMGFFTSSILIFIVMLTINHWFWEPSEGIKLNDWQFLVVWLCATSFLIIPAILLIVTKLKRGRV